MNKEKICKSYCGVTCINGSCPIALYYEDITKFKRKPSCKNCVYYKGCEDCCFENTDMCVKVGDKK